MSDDELARVLAGAQQGGEDDFRVLYRNLAPGLLSYLRVLVGDAAQDVASEAWLQIARDLVKFRGDADGFRGWCARIARNRAVDHLRRLRSRPVAAGMPVEEFVDLPAPDDTTAAALELADGSAALALIATLPPDQAEAVMLRVIVGLDAESAAAVLGKRAGAVRMAAHRGLTTLAARLEAGAQAEFLPGVTSRRMGALEEMR
ncbi:MAG: RNA polymerase sigma factor [Sporichthyaceae bacterium]